MGGLRDQFEQRPWLAAAFLAGAAALMAVKLTLVERHLYPHTVETVLLLTAGALMVPVLYLVASRFEERHFVLALGVVAPLAFVLPLGMYWGIGWAGAAGLNSDPATLPPGEQAFGAGSTLFLTIGCAFGAWLLFHDRKSAAAIATRRRAAKARAGTTHPAAVYEVRAEPNAQKQFEPYFVAMCDCDWVGPIRATSDEAFADARKHSPTVSAELKRPVG